MRSSSCWSRIVSSSSRSSSFEAKWWSSPGSLSPTRFAIVFSDAPRKPRVAKTSLAAARIASRRSRPLAYPRSRPVPTAGQRSQLEARLFGQVARRASDRQRVAPGRDDPLTAARIEVRQFVAAEAEGDDHAAAGVEADLRV